MAVSFSAEYLFRGATVLSNTPPEYNPSLTRNFGDQVNVHEHPNELLAALRAVYSLGVSLIAPCGVAYHAGAAGVCKLQTLWRSDVGVLNYQVQAHLEAAKCDALAFMVTAGSMFQVAILITLVVAPKFLFSLPIMMIVPSLALTAFHAFVITRRGFSLDFLIRSLLPLDFARNPLLFYRLLSEEQERSYRARFIYQYWVKAGVVVDRPLNEAEAQRIYEIETGAHYGNPLLSTLITTHRELLHWGRITPAWQARSEAIVAQGQAINAAWNGAVTAESPPQNATLLSGALQAIRERALIRIQPHLDRIHNALPPVARQAVAAQPERG
ncbi:MAG: hypothetical protein ACHQT8_07920 [Chlamydiales bacterium]